MPFVDGVFTRVDNSFSEPVEGTVIEPVDATQLFDDYDTGLTQSGLNVFNVATFVAAGGNAQDAIVAANAAGGGIVYFTADYDLGSGAVGLDLSGINVPIRLTGPGGPNAGTGQSVMLTYTGTGVAIDCELSNGIEISHLYLTCTGAGAKHINGNTSFALHVHDNNLYNTTSNVSNVGISLGGLGSQGAVIDRNSISILGGRGIIGVDTNFSVKAEIRNNTFHVGNLIAISAPGQAWRVIGNIFQGNGSVNQKFIEAGTAGTCDTLYLNGNDIDDGTFANVWVESNAGCLISVNNRYTGTLTTAISQANSTGAVVSIGDFFQGAVGVAIGVGNYLSINTPNQQDIPASLFTGAPNASNLNHVFGSVAQITSQLFMGISGTTQGSTQYLNTTFGATNTVLSPNTQTGNLTQQLPSTTGTILNTTNTATVGAKTLDTTNLYQATQTAANSVHYIPFFVDNSGSRALNIGATSSTLTYNPSIPSLGLGTPAVTTSLLSIGGGGGTLTSANQFAVSLQPTFSSACTSIGAAIYCAPSTVAASFTMTAGMGVYIDNGTKGAGSTVTTYYALRIASPTLGTTNYSIYSLGGRNFLTGGLALGTDVDPGNGALQASGFIKSTSASAGIGYGTGAGGTVTQITSKSTGVTLNTVTGQITMNNATLNANTSTGFTLTNSAIAATDIIAVNIKGGATAFGYMVGVEQILAGSCFIHIKNVSAGNLSEAVVLQFTVIKGSNS